MPNFAINYDKCSMCNICTEICFNYEVASDGKPKPIENLVCWECGRCVAVCPNDAIEHSSVSRDSMPVLDQSARPSYERFLEFLKMRRSRREFKDIPVPKDVIEKLLAAAVQAPNAMNKQQVQYTVITNPEIRKAMTDRVVSFGKKFMGWIKNPVIGRMLKLMSKRTFDEMKDYIPVFEKILELYEGGKDTIAWGAPCFIIIHTSKYDSQGPEDAIYPAANILLAAETLGLGTCVIGFLSGPMKKDSVLRKLAQLPNDAVVHTVVVVGYPKFPFLRTVPKKEANVSWIE